MNERCRGGIEGPTRPDQTERAQRECGWNGLAPVHLREELPARLRATRMRDRPANPCLRSAAGGTNARSRVRAKDTGTGGGQARTGFAGAPRPPRAAWPRLWNHDDPLRDPRSRAVHEPNCGHRKRLRSLNRGHFIQRAGSRSTRGRMARFFEPEPKLGAGRLRACGRGLQLCATKRSNSQKRRAAGQDPRDLAAWATTSRSADHLAGPPSLIESGAHEAGALARIIHGTGSATPIKGGFLRLRKGFAATDTECSAPQIRLVLSPARQGLPCSPELRQKLGPIRLPAVRLRLFIAGRQCMP